MQTLSSSSQRWRGWFLAIVLLCFVLTIPWLGALPFSTRGEPREALVAQAMLSSGDWVLPRGYSEDVPSKPPFMHWIIGGVSLIGGEVNEFTARLPSALGALFFIAALYLFLARRTSASRAGISCLVLLFSIEWFRASLACRVDMTLSALLAGGLLALFQWSERGLKGFPVVAALLLIGATLTKGPVSIVLPGGIFGVYLLLRREPLGRLVGKACLLGLPVLIGASVWYLLAWQRGGEDFAAKVLYENVARFSGTMEDKPHAHTAFYLYLTLLIGFIPWTLILGPTLLHAGFARIRRGLNVRMMVRGFLGLPPFDRFAAIAIFAFLLFFSIPVSKRGVYLLPAYPFIAYFIAGFIESAVTETIWRRATRVLGGVVVLLIACIAAFSFGLFELGWFVKKPNALFDATFFIETLASVGDSIVGTVAIVMLLLLGIVAVVRPMREGGFANVVVLLAGLFLMANMVVVPTLHAPLSLKRYAADVAPSVQDRPKLYSFGTEFYGVSFYLGREIYRATPEIDVGAPVLVLDRNIERLQAFLPPGRTTRTLSVSTYGVVKPRDRVALVEIIEGVSSQRSSDPIDAAVDSSLE